MSRLVLNKASMLHRKDIFQLYIESSIAFQSWSQAALSVLKKVSLQKKLASLDIQAFIIAYQSQKKFRFLNQISCTIIPAFSRSFIIRFKFCLLQSICTNVIIPRFTCISINSQYSKNLRRICQLQSNFRGKRLRKILRENIASQLENLHDDLIKLWNKVHVSLSYRSSFWSLYLENVSCLNLALCLEEIDLRREKPQNLKRQILKSPLVVSLLSQSERKSTVYSIL